MRRIIAYVLAFVSLSLFWGVFVAQESVSPTRNFLSITAQQEALSRGEPRRAAWSLDSTQLMVATHTDLWRYRADDLSAPAEKLYAFEVPLWDVRGLGFLDDTYLYMLEYLDETHALRLVNTTTGRATTKVRVSDAGAMSVSVQAGLFAFPSGKRARLFRATLGDAPRVQFFKAIDFAFDVSSVAFTPDGKTLVVTGAVGQRHEVHLVSLDDFTTRTVHRLPAISSVKRAFVLPDGVHVVLAGDYMAFRQVNLETGRIAFEYAETGYGLGDVVLAPDGRTLAMNIQFSRFGFSYDTQTGRKRLNLDEFANINDMAFSADGRLAIVGADPFRSGGSYVRIADSATGETLHQLPFGISKAVLVNQDRQLAFQIGERFYLQPVDEANSLPADSLTLPAWADLWGVSPDGTQLVVSGLRYENQRERIRLQAWDLTTKKPLGDVVMLSHMVDHIAYHPDGTTVALSTNGAVSLRDSQTLNQVREVAYLQQGQPVRKAFFSADGTRLVTIGESRFVRVWDNSYRSPKEYNVPLSADTNRVGFASLSSDGSRLLAGGGGTFVVFDLVSGNAVRTVEGISLGVQDGYLSADGKTAYLLMGHGLVLYDVANNRTRHTYNVTRLPAFSADERQFFEYGARFRRWAFVPDGAPEFVERVLAQSNFAERGQRGWQNLVQVGKVTREGGETFVRMTNSSSNDVSIEAMNVTARPNSAFEMRVRIMQGFDQRQRPGFDLMIVQTDTGVGLYNTTQWRVHTFSTREPKGYAFANIRYGRMTDEWMHVRVEAIQTERQRGELRVYIDGALVSTTVDLPVRWGKFSFVSVAGTVVDIADLRLLELVPYQEATATPPPTATPAPTRTPTPMPTPTTDPSLRFQDNFEGGSLEAWDVSFAGGAVRLAQHEGNGVLWVDGTQGDYISLGLKEAYDDAKTFEMRVMLLGESREYVFNMNLLSQMPGHARGFSALVSPNGAFLAERRDDFNPLNSIQSQPLTLEHHRWYTLRFQLKGNLLSLLVDGVSVNTARVNPASQSGSPLLIFDAGLSMYIDDVILRR
jgi:WD40 repeat protein